MDERQAYIALNMMEKVGPVGIRMMRETLGSAAAIFEADTAELMRARGVGREQAAAIVSQRDRLDWQGELERCEARGIRVITQIDSDYPGQLLEIHDPPLALYVKGTLQSRDRQSIAVVGTRRPSVYGRMCAENLSAQLARAGLVIVSGLARGIDTSAHGGCLKAQGRTLAVLGGGLESIYPEENRALAERIAEQGALISELPLDRKPDKTTFPMRNRVVSGLTLGTLVVEAGEKSGALITAARATEHNRMVFAVPGRIDAPGSRGPHSLIRDGARIVTRVDDILEELDALIPRGAAARAGETAQAGVRAGLTFSDSERALIDLLEDGEQPVDTLIRGAGIPASQVNALLIGLEMKRVVRMLPGRLVEKVR